MPIKRVLYEVKAYNQAMFIVEFVVAAIIGYAAGLVMMATAISRLMKLPDPRSYGSMNPGATNVSRQSKFAGALTMIGDVAKAALPMLALHAFGFTDSAVVLCGCAAFAGHVLPLGQATGGKGVATFLGVLFVVHSLAALLFVLTWLVTVAATRYSAAAGVTATTLTPAFIWMYDGDALRISTTVVMAAVVVWRHRENISRFRAGTERQCW